MNNNTQSYLGYVLSIGSAVLVFFALCYGSGSRAQTGDVAPRSAPDGVLSINDLLLVQRHLAGLVTLSPAEIAAADIAPVGSPDGILNTADLLLYQQVLAGTVELPNSGLAPQLDALSSVSTEQNPFLITGIAEPMAEVVVYVNGLPAVIVTAVEDGSFEASVPLVDGSNTLQATQNLSGSESDFSNALSVDYVNTQPRNLDNANISVDTVWTPGASGAAYVISGDITVEAGAELILQPGVEVVFLDSTSKMVIHGSVDAAGSSTAPVILRSDVEPLPEVTSTNIYQWRGLEVLSGGELNLSHADISGAQYGVRYRSGSSGDVADSVFVQNVHGLRLENVSTPVSGTVFQDNFYGIYLQGDSSPSIIENSFVDNRRSVSMHTVAGFSPFPQVNQNSFENTSSYSYDDLSCSASGSRQCHIYLSSYDVYGAQNVDVRNNWWGTVDIVAISDRIYDYTDYSPEAAVDYSGFLDAPNGTAVSGNFLFGAASQGTALQANTNYTLLGDWLVPAGVSVTIPEGVSVSVAGNWTVDIEGQLLVAGQPDNSVRFSSNINPLPPVTSAGIYQWRGLEVLSGGELNLSHADISGAQYGVRYRSGSSGDVADSVFVQNSHGLRLENVSTSVSGSVFQDNFYGIYLQGDSSPTITGNEFVDNLRSLSLHTLSGASPFPQINHNSFQNTAGYANDDLACTSNNSRQCHIYLSSYSVYGAQHIDARNNWWGTTDLNAIADRLFDFTDSSPEAAVDYSAYLDAPGGTAVLGNFLFGAVSHGMVLQANTDYTLLGKWRVPADVSLTIPEGVTVNVDSNWGVVVEGQLVVAGQSSNPVRFTSTVSPLPDVVSTSSFEWLGLEVVSGGRLDVSYTELSGALHGIVYRAGSSGQVDNSIFSNNVYGLRLQGVSVLVDSNVFHDNYYAVYGEGDNASQIYNNTFTDNLRSIHLQLYTDGTVSPQINHNSFVNTPNYSRDKGVCNGGLQFQCHIAAYTNTLDAGWIIDARNNWWGTNDVTQIAELIYDYTESDHSPAIDFSAYKLSANGVSDARLPLVGAIQFDSTLVADGSYLLLGKVKIRPGVELTVPSGVQIYSPSTKQASQAIYVDGSLVVAGSETAPTVFTSDQYSAPDAQQIHDYHWGGIYVQNGGSLAMSYALVEHARYGVFFDQSGSGSSIDNSELRDNVYGITIARSSSSPYISQNTFLGNNISVQLQPHASFGFPSPTISGNAFIDSVTYHVSVTNLSGMHAGVIDARNNWWGSSDPSQIAESIYDFTESVQAPAVDFAGFLDQEGGVADSRLSLIGIVDVDTILLPADYLLLGKLQVAAGVSLTVSEGSTVTSLASASPNQHIQVFGELIVSGSASNPVTFSSDQLLPPASNQSHWRGILVEQGGIVTISHALIEHAASGVRFLQSGAGSLVSNSEFLNNQTGVYIDRSAEDPIISGNRFEANNNALFIAIWSSDGLPSPQINANAFIQSNDYHVQLLGGHATLFGMINARNNWWGVADGAQISSLIYDYNDSQGRPLVDYSGYLDSEDGMPDARLVLGGLIQSDTTLQASQTYLLIARTVVESGATLTIPEGVRIESIINSSPSSLQRVEVEGGLVVEGVEGSPVVFTSEAAIPPENNTQYHWGGILVLDGGILSLNHAVVERAQYGIKVDQVDMSTISVVGTTFQHNMHGLHVSYGLLSEGLSENNFLSNRYGIYADSVEFSVSGSDLIDNLYAIYAINDSNVSAVGNMFEDNMRGFFLRGQSVYNSSSSSFDYINPVAVINQNSFVNSSDYQADQLACSTSQIRQCHIHLSNYTNANSVPSLIIDATDNWWGTADLYGIADRIYDYTDNPGVIGVVDFGGFLSAEGGLPSVQNMLRPVELSDRALVAGETYYALTEWRIENNVSITIPDGVNIIFPQDGEVVVYGDLVVNGTPDAPVTFGSDALEKAYWDGITIRSTGSITMSSAVVQGADKAINFTPDASGQVSESLLQNNTAGITVVASSPSISSNIIRNNTNGLVVSYSGASSTVASPLIEENAIFSNTQGILLSGINSDLTNPQPVVAGNDIFNNFTGSTIRNVRVNSYVGSALALDFTGNWFGVENPTKITAGLADSSNVLDFSGAASAPLFPGLAAENEIFASDYVSASLGLGDSLMYSAALNLSAGVEWRYRVFNEYGEEVFFFTEGANTANFLWDGVDSTGADADDGIYTLLVSGGESGQQRPLYVKSFIIDTQAPQASFDLSLVNKVFVESTTEDLIGTVDDENFSSFAVDIRSLGSSDAWQPITTVNASQSISSGLLVRWHLGNLEATLLPPYPNGDYELRLTAVDRAGNTSEDIVPVTIDLIPLHNVQSSISPDSYEIDMQAGDVLTVDFDLLEPGDVTLRVFELIENEQGDLVFGEMVYTQMQSYVASGTYSITWDGQANNPGLSAGIYEYVLETSRQGTVHATYDTGINFPSRLPTNVVNDENFAPDANDFMAISFTVADPRLLSIRADTTMGQFYIVVNEYFAKGDHTYLWNGQDVDGNIVYGDVNSLYMTDTASPALPTNSFYVVEQDQVAIQGAEPSSIEVKANPYRATHSFDQFSQFSFTISDDADVTIKLLPPGVSDIDSTEAIIMTNESGEYYDALPLSAVSGQSLAVYEVQWLGYVDTDTNNILVSQEGGYSFVILAESANGSVAEYRGNLHLYQ